MKTTIITVAVFLLLLGCTSRRPDDGIINEETVLNSTTGEVDMSHSFDETYQSPEKMEFFSEGPCGNA